MRGFFPASEFLGGRMPLSVLPKCGACGLYKTCKSPKMPVSGKGKKGILIVAEAPGKEEDKRGIQLVGNSGSELTKRMRKFGVDMRVDCWLTNALICRPPNNEIKDEKAVAYCRPNLIKTLEELQPRLIILLGYYAVKSLIPYIWKDEVGDKLTKWAGWRIPSQKLNAYVCPTYHPAYLLHAKDPVLDLFFDKYLEAALELEDRPWKVVPDYRSQIQRIYKDKEAEQAIYKLMDNAKGAVAFDYETNMLKPDSEQARIYTCSMSDGKTTIAYPWRDRAQQATRSFLRSRIPKIASNMQFEEIWTLKEFGHGVCNWECDTMLASHWLDNRSGITGIKFQSFVVLGVPSYNERVEQLLESPKSGGNELNRIHEIEKSELLLYNGMDSLLEWLVAKRHKLDPRGTWQGGNKNAGAIKKTS